MKIQKVSEAQSTAGKSKEQYFVHWDIQGIKGCCVSNEEVKSFGLKNKLLYILNIKSNVDHHIRTSVTTFLFYQDFCLILCPGDALSSEPFYLCVKVYFCTIWLFVTSTSLYHLNLSTVCHIITTNIHVRSQNNNLHFNKLTKLFSVHPP